MSLKMKYGFHSKLTTDELGMADECQSTCSYQVLKRKLRWCLYFADGVVACMSSGPLELCQWRSCISDRLKSCSTGL